ncbi:MAG: BFD-like (2Fe-2S) protein [Caproiciproducens sp.]|jgi:bacterioferritin-associated ferredoxin|uniref:(2Fe-2S)-binding protein n=1 Tax=Sinanaerobacter chloroacetimidivorans TaxID=2818044 RepID=A0A8J8B3T2_9FIRM|nr:(2Fe-2S)-binding protein [Sinanaerobacter chloroacetimidivorans]MBR0600101.1 (2Fe-2S)-binding protein [Sinanaerobacter chloroacetimidivorans]MDF2632851.1 BFD-like (2Fe-2S) protein [Caproiciproducens sp.]
MEKETLNKCCCGNSEKSSCEVGNNNLCPVCEKQGTLVKNITVKHMVLDELTEQIGDKDYFLCMSEECDITYYNTESNIKFNKQQVKVPIWFKNGANPKYACYCSKVTEEQVITAVVKDGAKNMKDVLKLTGAMKNAQCQKNNPLGKCCHQIVQDAIDKGLSIK